jgi:hypothetical protein
MIVGVYSAMLMYFAGRDVNHTFNLESLRPFPFGTNEACAN